MDWTPARSPRRTPLAGTYVTVEPVDSGRHAESLWEAKGTDPDLWTYLSNEPFRDSGAFRSWVHACSQPDDPLCFAIVDHEDGRAKGMASYLRIEPAQGVIEVGSIWIGPDIQRTRQATEAIYLLAREVFEELGYRRLEWKCDSLNAPSLRAAIRFGFTYEGLFRQAVVYKNRNRDTAWFSLLDHEWPETRVAFDTWLAPENFDSDGRQRAPLAARREQATSQDRRPETR